uniref:Uncharacterized protein n=1 Tax=Glossina austeni TaxID=7395 RepID=A0A1A9VHS1_GLOAU
MCYVCDNCPVITADIPLLNCNEHFFNSDTTTRTTTTGTTTIGATSQQSETESTLLDNTDATAGSSDLTTKIMTTTSLKPTEAMNSSFTTMMTETTTLDSLEKTTKTYPKTTAAQEDNSNSTEDLNVNTGTTTTPVTNIAETTTEDNLNESKTTKVYSRLSAPKFKSDFVSSQINETLIKVGEDETEAEITTSKIFKPSAQSHSRKARHTTDQIYNCFKVEAKVNGSTNIARGCSRRTPPQTACKHWQEMHNNIKVDECYSCTSSECNGSSMTSVSVATLLIVLVAGCFHYH